jgi:hypothetical protein
MSWATCYSGCNNVIYDLPPLMSDGRNYSGWQPEATINEQIRTENGIVSNWKYRQYLTNNASAIMKYNTQEASQETGLNPYATLDDYGHVQNNPLLFTSQFDSRRPAFGYCDSDLKNPYLSRQQLAAKMIAPSIIIPFDPKKQPPSSIRKN